LEDEELEKTKEYIEGEAKTAENNLKDLKAN
jgi:hypothetical protein